MQSVVRRQDVQTTLSPFVNNLQEWQAAGRTRTEWLEAGRQRVEDIQSSPHFHNWIPCADWHKHKQEMGH